MLETKGDTEGNLDKRGGPEMGPRVVLLKGNAQQATNTHCNFLAIA